MHHWLCLGLLCCWLTPACAELDLLIRGGRVFDGTGNPSFHADIGVKDGRITAVGRVTDPARLVISATNLAVAPGFIDVHTHADEVAEMPDAENFIRMGVTTIVAGNCGSSTLDFGAFFRQLELTNLALNVASLVGHNDVRRRAMGGSFDRPPTDGELAAMRTLVDRAMKSGAAGLSTGLIYQPGVFASTEEIIELARVAAAAGGIYASHMRYEDTRITRALDEVFRIAREAPIPVHVSHLKLSGPSAWGQANMVLDYLAKARKQGIDVTHDQYAYTAASTGLSQLIPDSALEGGAAKLRERLADPARKAGISREMVAMLERKGRHDFAYAVIASCRQDPSLNGLNVVEAAQKRRGATNLADQIDVILDIQLKGGASGVFHGMSEDDVRTIMRHPDTMFACDSGLRRLGEGMPHPRGYGNNARILGTYVRDEHVLTLEDAIRKMTSLPAATFRFKDRGLLRTGAWADIVIFDPRTVTDPATYKDPHHYAEGFRHVIVNGIPVLQEGKHTHAKAGQPLRRNGSI
jgi:N-acyl-D-amino-acid deacylase